MDGDPVHSWPASGARATSGTAITRAGCARVTFLAGIVLLAATWTGAAPAKAPGNPVVKATHEVAALLSPHEALSRPAAGSTRLRVIQARRPITGVRTALPVLGRRTGPSGVRWLRVRLPGRPNARSGWIRRQGTVSFRTKWHIVIRASSRRVAVYRYSRRVRVFMAVVGKASTPTPRGRFFVEEVIQMPAGAAGAPFAFALSARSNVLQEFAGGPGQIGLHGLRNIGGTLGTAVSHGCVRLDDRALRWLVTRIGPGVPVTITR